MHQSRREPDFGHLWNEAYSQATRSASADFAKSFTEAYPPLVGHPDFEHLQIGQTIPGTTIACFMDIRGFTRLAMALDPAETVRILQATLATTIICIQWYGGHVADLTGDGIMALFNGGGLRDEQHAFNAACATAMLVKGIRETVNQRLQSQDDQTVRVAAGLEYGEVTWTRLGVPGASQVKPVGGISFLAGKLATSSHTDSWQCKIGQNLAAWVPDAYKARAAQYEFQFRKTQYAHALYLFDWETFHRDYQVQEFALRKTMESRSLPTIGGTVIGAAGIQDLSETTGPRGGPHVLKDRPFFADPISR